MKYLKLYEDFEIDPIEQLNKKIEFWHSYYKTDLKKYEIKNFKININSSGQHTVDVDGDVFLDNKKLTKIPLKFGKITGSFYCNKNKLTSLEGCPSEVGGDFDCSSNELSSLKGCPSEVGQMFNCCKNKLTSLEGCPSEVGGDFYCRDNNLTDLGISSIIGGTLFCDGNEIDPENYTFYGELGDEDISFYAIMGDDYYEEDEEYDEED